MSNCKVCGKQVRKTRIAFIMAEGALKGARVCLGCAKDGILLVAAKPLQRVVEKGAPVDKAVLKNLVAQVKALRASIAANRTADLEAGCSKPFKSDFIEGKVEGLENAIVALGGRV